MLMPLPKMLCMTPDKAAIRAELTQLIGADPTSSALNMGTGPQLKYAP